MNDKSNELMDEFLLKALTPSTPWKHNKAQDGKGLMFDFDFS